MKRTILLFASGMLLIMTACKKSSLSNGKIEQEKSTALYSPEIIPEYLPMWFRIYDNPHDRYKAFAFTINSKGYVGGGLSTSPILASGYGSLKSMYLYDSSFNLWLKREDLPGYSTESTACFVIGNKAYISTGYHHYTGPDTSLFERYLKDTWEYDALADHWTKKADFPGGARSGAVGMSINGKGYVGLGKTRISIFGSLVDVLLNDWWEYDPATDSWTKKKNFPGAARDGAAGCAAGSFGYLGTGYNSTGNLLNDWWRYDPATDNWVQRSSLPGPVRSEAVAFSSTDLAGPKAYVATGYNNIINPNDPTLSDLWRYDPASNQWAQSFSMPFGRRGAACFVANNVVYVGGGSHKLIGTPNSYGGPTTEDYWGFHL